MEFGAHPAPKAGPPQLNNLNLLLSLLPSVQIFF
jgi:hypothetical protein